MNSLQSQSIDLILADPPYGTTTCKWDSVIPLPEMWSQLKRIIKKNKAIVLSGVEPFSSQLRFSNLDEWKYDWIWYKSKPFGFFNCKLRPMTKHEIISVFSSGATANCSHRNMPYNPQGLIYKPHKVKGKHNSLADSNGHQLARPSHKEEYISEYTNYPNTVLEIASEARPIDPTQKPVIETYTKEGETVLDFCFGSGTTAVACKNLNRNFVGFEMNEIYFKIAEGRLAAI